MILVDFWKAKSEFWKAYGKYSFAQFQDPDVSEKPFSSWSQKVLKYGGSIAKLHFDRKWWIFNEMTL